eukprot:IDg15831t1
MAFVPAALAPLRPPVATNNALCKHVHARRRTRASVRAEIAPSSDGAATDAVEPVAAKEEIETVITADADAQPDESTDSEQVVSMPKLYGAWFKPGHELTKQMHSAVSRAYDDGVRMMEVQWPVVPNLEEIAAGTRLNQLFGLQVAADLSMDAPADYQLIKRYLASFCNLYWAREVARAPPFKGNGTLALFGDSVNKSRADVGSLQVASMRKPPALGARELAIVVDPRADDMWMTGARMRKEDDQAVVFLNSQFSETYGLTGPRRGPLRDTKVVYYLKRITRGYVFFAYPGPWKAYLEKPDMSVEV